MSAPPQSVPRLRKRSVRTVLLWGGAAASPVLLMFALQVLPRGPQIRPDLPELWTQLPRGPQFQPGLWFLVPMAAILLPMGLLARAPLWALGLQLVGLPCMALTMDHTPWNVDFLASLWLAQVLAIDVTVGVTAGSRRRRVSVLAAVLALGQLASGVLHIPGMNMGDWVTKGTLMVLGIAVAWLVGNTVRSRRLYNRAWRAREAAEAVQAERVRIARELHDMVSHSIGVIAIQAGMGSRVIETQPAEARCALAAIEDTSRETLAGLRRMLGALRQADPSAGPAPLGPAPGLADLDALVARSLDAGVTVEVERRGDTGPLPPDIELAGYRIVQEAVTNVGRHARAGRCTVLIDRSDGALAVEVTDDGVGGDAGTGAGYGIPGMRERVGLLHGEFTAGPRAEGGFRVAARIPVPAP